MRHRKAGIKLNRTTSHRNAMFRNMVTSLFKYERIRTTDAKAKELRRLADRMVTLAKRGDLHARRQALSVIREKDVVHKLFEEFAERYKTVSGGYTRVVKLGTRPGDSAPISLVELIAPETKKKKKTPKKKTKAAPSKKESAKSVSPAPGKEKTEVKKTRTKSPSDDPGKEKPTKADTVSAKEKTAKKKVKATSRKKEATVEKKAKSDTADEKKKTAAAAPKAAVSKKASPEKKKTGDEKKKQKPGKAAKKDS